MRDITSQVELALLQEAGEGFVLNASKLHRAGCNAVGAMAISAYRKVFFDTYEEAQQWLDVKFVETGWERCGICHPSD